MNEADIIAMLDQMVGNDVSRIKVETSEDISEGDYIKKSHHGRCDVGSPFATGQLYDFFEDGCN